MAIEQINLGTVVQEGADGDVARVAFTKVNANFADLESRKVEKVTGKQLSTEDYTSAEKMKLGGIESGAQVNTVTSVAGKTGAVALVKGDVGLGNVDNTSDVNKPVSTATQTALNLKANAATQIIAGTGLTGGGTLDTNRTLAVSYGTTAGTATQGNDSRLSDAREWSAETVSQAEAEAGAATTRRAWTAQRVRQAIVAWWNSVSSAWGRGFVASADATTARTTLGLGTASIANLTTSNTDVTAGRALKTGDAGILGPTPGYNDGNLLPNGLGFYCWCMEGSGSVNLPIGAVDNWQGIESGGPNANRGFTIAAALGRGKLAFRTRSAGVNSAWREIFHTDNILGTVSQSAGIPTGAIIERGSNANGEYVRFADGTQIVHITITGPFTMAAYGSTGIFRGEKAITWPATFASTPSVSGVGVDNDTYGLLSAGGSTGVGCTISYFSMTRTVIATDIKIIAVGLWY